MIPTPIPVSILICTRNRVDHLRQALATVARLEVPAGLRPELVVVDGDSSDATAETVRTLALPNMPVRFVRAARPGVGIARNLALRAAQGRILLFTDDDTRLPKHWLEGMCAPILSGEADAVAGQVVLAAHLQRAWMQPFHRAVLASTEAMREDDPEDLFGASMAFSREVLTRVPAFDPELGPGTAVGGLEDTLFAWQLRQAGYRLLMAPDVVVEHHPDVSRLSRAAFIAAAQRLGRSRAYLAYHWQHETEAALAKVPFPWLNLALRALRWVCRRCLRWKECRGPEGIPEWEFSEIRHIYSVLQYMKERKRPRNYEKRGLVRRGTVPDYIT